MTKDDHAKLHKIHFGNLLHKSNKDHDKPSISKLNVPGAKVICACCAKEMNHIDWEEHNLTHNNLAWIQGQTPVVSILYYNFYYKLMYQDLIKKNCLICDNKNLLQR